MKRTAGLISLFLLITAGCSNLEKNLHGTWMSPEVKGFVAEFKEDHTGTVTTRKVDHVRSPLEVTPFQWEVLDDGSIKVTEGSTTYFGKLVEGQLLEMEINRRKTILEKVN